VGFTAVTERGLAMILRAVRDGFSIWLRPGMLAGPVISKYLEKEE